MNEPQKLIPREAVLSRLREAGIPFELYEHEAVYNMAEARALKP